MYSVELFVQWRGRRSGKSGDVCMSLVNTNGVEINEYKSKA